MPNHDQAGDDVAEDRQDHQAALPDQAAPARVQDDRVPEHDEQRAVFLRVPAPEAAPRLVGPDAAEHRADEAEERGEADDAVDHPRERIWRLVLSSERVKTPRDDVDDARGSRRGTWRRSRS